MPLHRRLDCWRHGFLTRAAVLYDFRTHDRDAFVNDVQFLDQWRANREEQVFMERKLRSDGSSGTNTANTSRLSTGY